MRKLCLFLVFVSVLCMSMINAKLFGISLNKVGLIPFALALIISIFSLHIDKQKGKIGLPFWLMVVFLMLSLVSGLTALSWEGVFQNRIEILNLYILQIPIYAVVLIMLAINPNKAFMNDAMKKSLIYVARIQAIWALLQFIAYAASGTDINGAYLPFLFGKDYTATYINLPAFGGIFLRATGLNSDAAFLGLFLMIGFILDRRVFFKILYFVTSVIALSRSAMLCIGFVLVISIIRLFLRKELSKKVILALVGAVLVGAVLFLSVPAIQGYATAMIGRFTDMGSANDGNGRHTKYFVETLDILFYKFDPFQVLFGNGPRVSGSTMVYYSDNLSIFQDDMFVVAWAAESDFAELLLGYGILGASVYLIHAIVLAHYSRTFEERMMFIMILVLGLMYNLSALGIIFLIRMVSSAQAVHPIESRFVAFDDPSISRSSLRKAKYASRA